MSRLKKLMNTHPFMCNFILNIYNHFQCRGKRGNRTNFVCRGILKKCKFNIIGSGNTIVVGEASRLKNCTINVVGTNNMIVIGSESTLINTEFYIEDEKCCITIGDNTLICGKTQLAAIEGCSISIGNKCLFSSDINLRTGDSHSILDEYGNRINPSRNIRIDDHVWVGNKVIILKGVHLEENTIVATGAVVTKSHNKQNCIIAGNPGRIIKENIHWKTKRIN